MTKLEIIDETVAYYSEDVSRRALDSNGECQYLTEEGKECAVGRCMVNSIKNNSRIVNVSVNRIIEKLEIESIDDLLEPEYHGHDIKFWERLQDLHDRPKCWDENGLSEYGLFLLHDIKEIYKGE